MLPAVARHLVGGGGDSPIVAVPPGVLVEADVEYLLQPGRAERGDLYQPTQAAAGGNTLRPAVLVIHGGGWYGGDKGAVREINICSNLVLHGYVCFSIDYLLADAPPADSSGGPLAAGRAATFPQNLYDCMRGVQFLRQHAVRLHIDPRRIGVIGGSAGGTLAHLLALQPPALQPTDVVAAGLDPMLPCAADLLCGVNLYGPVDFSCNLADIDDRAAGEQPMFDGPISTHPALYATASPTIYAKGAGDTPLFLLHGETDALVDIRQSSSYCEKATRLGAPVRFQAVPDTLERGFHGLGMQPPLADLRGDLIGFFDSHLK